MIIERAIRGQTVKIDSENKKIYVSIRKPMGNVFSLSDGIMKYHTSGYSIYVMLPNTTKIIKPTDEPFKREEVKSKFLDSHPWFRFWYVIEEKKVEVQEELF